MDAEGQTAPSLTSPKGQKGLNFLSFKGQGELENWTLTFDELYQNHLCDEGKTLKISCCEELARYARLENQKDFRLQILLDNVAFLVTFLFSSRSIVILSPQAKRELYTLEDLSHEKFDFPEVLEKSLRLRTENFSGSLEIITKQHHLPNYFAMGAWEDLEDVYGPLRKQLHQNVQDYKASMLEFITDFGLNLTAGYALIRVHLLKFLAILPSLDHDQQGDLVKTSFLEAMRRLADDSQKARENKYRGQKRALPRFYENIFWGAGVIAGWIPAKLFAFLVRSGTRIMARRFIAGENISQAKKALRKLRRSQRDATLDQLGELVVSEKEADHYRDEVIKLIHGYSQHVKAGEKNKAGISKAHISIKVSALCSDFKAAAFEKTYQRVAPRLRKILLEAKNYQVFINIDAEHYHYRDIVFDVYKKVLLETPELQDYGLTGIVIQTYLRDAYEHLKEVRELARQRKISMPVRLVKGAYWDAETIEAEVQGVNAPQFLNKPETDLHFRQCIYKVLEWGENLQLSVASHNISDHAFAESLRIKKFPHAPLIEHQCLHMTYEALSLAMAEMGWVVRNYVPVGSLLVGMAYLVRRIMENSSQVGILSQMRSNKKGQLQKTAVEIYREIKASGELVHDGNIKLLSDFKPCPHLRLYVKSEREAFDRAKEKWDKEFKGKLFSNAFSLSGKKQEVFSSSDKELLVGSLSTASSEDAARAVETAGHYFKSGEWSGLSPQKRGSVLQTVAETLRLKRDFLSQHIAFEAGKSYEEAIADVDEAIDFLQYYSYEIRRVMTDSPQLVGRGVCVVISPWNFPLAIPAGMVSAPLVAGNSVILKSAEQTPLIAQILVDIFHQAGVPKEALIHLPGEGETVGQSLVDDPRVGCYVFTGSKSVGTMIYQKAQSRLVQHPTQDLKFSPKVITEMGGKNAIIIGPSAELDETVAGCLYSIFAHGGQKCSAASRILVHESVKESFLKRFIPAANDLSIGQAFDHDTALNPLIGEAEKEVFLSKRVAIIDEVKEFGGKVHLDKVTNLSSELDKTYCVGPLIVELPKLRALARDSYAQRELFAPCVHIIPYSDKAEAVEFFNATPYALTGGIFSQSQDEIDYYLEFLEAGNLYVNRSCTGARVGIEPFGGFKHSGTGPKAGGRNYMASFLIDTIEKNKWTTNYDETQKSHDLHLRISSPSRLSLEGRVQRLEKGLSYLLQNFDSLRFGGMQDKKNLMDFKNWTYHNLSNYLQAEHLNHRIPGQWSYDSFAMIKERGFMLVGDSRPHIKTFLHLFSAVVLGSGITVMAINNEAYKFWLRVIQYLQQAGFSSENLNIFFPTKEKCFKYLDSAEFDFVILDFPESLWEEWLPRVAACSQKRHMLAFHHYLDSPPVDKFKRYYKQFILTRSLAVNVMRHGAPLDIEVS